MHIRKSLRKTSSVHAMSQRDPAPAAKVAAAYRRAIELVADLADRDGTLVLPVLQPMPILPDSKPLTTFEREIVARHERTLIARNAYHESRYAELRTALNALRTERLAVNGFAATSAFQDEAATCYVDHCHLTPRGREVLMKAIGHALLTRLAQQR